MFMPELHSFRFRELSHVLYDRSLLSHDIAQRPRYIQNLRHAFPVREVRFSVKSFDPEKSFFFFSPPRLFGSFPPFPSNPVAVPVSPSDKTRRYVLEPQRRRRRL